MFTEVVIECEVAGCTHMVVRAGNGCKGLYVAHTGKKLDDLCVKTDGRLYNDK